MVAVAVDKADVANVADAFVLAILVHMVLNSGVDVVHVVIDLIDVVDMVDVTVMVAVVAAAVSAALAAVVFAASVEIVFIVPTTLNVTTFTVACAINLVVVWLLFAVVFAIVVFSALGNLVLH